ncbi:NADP-dependent malic enzyme [Patulibacter medicamentivorans]|uniref:NADP-dependent malic enzyme n=1 Tax=Patulibacter medicamentivorans TaxID=1097667 RepID=H0E1V9_9ACTN|nr:NAD-dependent malic enzyme [Patulibacter medicamentivorans]EHN12351.1 NADP-dependent malic enzyme [Patulibacter medicamentivorans]
MTGSPSAQYSIVLRVEIDHKPGALGEVASAIGQAGGVIGDVALVSVSGDTLVRDITVAASDQGAWDRIAAAINQRPQAKVVAVTDRTFQVHEGGKIEISAKHPLKTRDDLAMAYTPGVARVCEAIADDQSLSHELTIRKNTVAVVTDGTAVLGLGDIGPHASMPVMEGKAVLFKEFAGVDAFPIALSTKDPDAIVETVKAIAPTFGGINLEDISAPRCFEIEDRLKAELDIPVFHDDQHGTAIVTLAALINACKITGKRLEDLSVLVTGLGAAGIAVTKILLSAGVKDIIGADSRGLVSTERPDYVDGSMNSVKRWYAEMSNPEHLTGHPGNHLGGRDLFIGLSGARIFEASKLAAMNADAMVFAMANPNPEVSPEEAEPYARIIATGRSDYPNQINNVLAFPGIFRGALDARAKQITEGMKMAAARAIAGLVADEDLREDNIIPSVFDRDVAPAVAAAVAQEALAHA